MNQISTFRQQDRSFVALVDGAFEDAARRSGPHLLCRPGCAQCCVGAFAVGPADGLRIQQGLKELAEEDPARSARVQTRAIASWARLAALFPGDSASGRLATDKDGNLLDSFEHFANEEVCPALDPLSGTCDLYQARPHTCRVFGPPVATPEGYGVCELCFQGASSQEIAAAAISPVPDDLPETMDELAIAASALPGPTILAFLLSRSPSR